MKSICLLILASLVVCNLTACGGQSISDEDETTRIMTIDDIILQRAKSLLLRSLLQKMQEDDMRDERSASQAEWVTKRQHPGKRYGENVEKRQHPGRREEDVEAEERFDFQKRQHPGKRSATGDSSETPIVYLMGELSKRQHPGKRYVLLHGTKRQHPGKRLADEGGDYYYGDWNADADEDEDLAAVEKRQHPGKRFTHNSMSPDLGTDSPCEASLNPAARCSETSLLLDFLDNINKSHTEEKRQHPGKRFAPEEDLVEAGE